MKRYTCTNCGNTNAKLCLEDLVTFYNIHETDNGFDAILETELYCEDCDGVDNIGIPVTVTLND